MNDEKLIFRPVIEALFIGGLGDRMTPAFKAQLKGLGVDLAKLVPGYPYATWEKAVQLTPGLFPELSTDQALVEGGRRMVSPPSRRTRWANTCCRCSR